MNLNILLLNIKFVYSSIIRNKTVMTVEKAFNELVESGFKIEQFETDKFMVYDNGKFGFVSEEDPFIVDGDGVLEIYEMYM